MFGGMFWRSDFVAVAQAGNSSDADPRECGRLLDEGLDRLGGFWSGGFRPLPLQRPRIPVWVAAGWPNRRPFPIGLPGPEGLAEEVQRARDGDDAPLDLVVEVPPGADVHAWEVAGATWVLIRMGPQSPAREVRAVADAGP
jgi:hypothetical protein